MLIRRLSAFFVTAAIAFATQADSDGSYCVADNYLAYELQQSETGGTHTLVVLRADLDEINVTLPEFQVHRMRCTAGAIQLAGWDATYTVDLSANPLRVSLEPLSRPGEMPNWPSTNLAQWNRDARDYGSAIVELPWDVPHFVKITIVPAQAACTGNLSTRLYRRGTTQPVRTLIEREVGLECGE